MIDAQEKAETVSYEFEEETDDAREPRTLIISDSLDYFE